MSEISGPPSAFCPLPTANSELRRDSIVDRWVIFAPNRAARPNEFAPPPLIQSDKPCPFCEGHEALATPEIASYRSLGTQPHQPGWRVRVVPNKYPAFASIGARGSGVGFADESQPAERPARETDSRPLGIQEVIIESPRHIAGTVDLTEAELAEVLSMYRQRLLAAAQDPRIRHAIVFKNVGPGAGASLEHTHSQLVGMSVVPPFMAEELSATLAYHQQHARCLFCDLLANERATASRIVLETEQFMAFCPYAARFPLETWLLPRQHGSHFEAQQPPQLAELATILRSCIERIERIAGRSEYNYLIHSAPFDTHSQSHYHWHIEIFPRLATTAGFEWGTGMFINPVLPEEAARLLREA